MKEPRFRAPRLLGSILRWAGYELCRADSQPFVPKLDARLARRILFLSRLFEMIRHVPGDIVECGVWQGATLIALAVLTASENKGRVIWGFDSFRGLPPLSSFDESRHFRPDEGLFSDTSEARVLATFRAAGFTQTFLRDQIRLVAGLFEDSLQEYKGDIALLHIDADLYSSYRTVLEMLYHRVSPGGVIAFDEYLDENWPGATRAILEFLGENNSVQIDEQSGKAFVVIDSR